MTKATELNKIFKNQDLLLQALTHKSWVNENKGKRDHNERLEFLGDAVLEYVVSSVLFRKFTEKKEGYLTALRANFVNTKNLSVAARAMGAGESLYLSNGEEEGGGRKNASLLANTFEAIVGALYLDSGLEVVAEFIETNLLADLEQKIREPLKDPKSLLQEKIQSKGLVSPKYIVINEDGPDHDKRFSVEVMIDKKAIARGMGNSKSEAQQEAAKAALIKLT